MENPYPETQTPTVIEVQGNAENEPPTGASPDASREDNAKAAQLAWGKRRKDGYEDYGSEMGKDARIWKLYVEETKRVDEEMVKGWNDSLDVLLLFAALFSAISTAFVATSSQALQQDPADTSAQTLLVISQTLLSLSNGHILNSTTLAAQDPVRFTPSRIAVIINTLWFLSLSLSVAVSLIAMLAKEWCHAFVSGRSGEIYNRGRLRQKRWNEIERLKMIDAMTFLPILMHLALLLFAIGLCVFLWDISIPVALPVIVITSICLVVYVITTAHSLTSDHCPYTTASSKIVKSYIQAWLKSPKPLFSPWTKPIAAYLDSWLKGLTSHLVPWLMRTKPWAQNIQKSMVYVGKARDVVFALAQRIKDYFQHETVADEIIATDEAMDLTTSQMIAWMVRNCEDVELSSVVVQALAGAEPWLPRLPLLESGVLKIVFQHLNSTFDHISVGDIYFLRPTESFELASLYLRALHFLLGKHNGHYFFQNDQEEVKDSWGRDFYPNNYAGMAWGLRMQWPDLRMKTYSKEADIAAFWSTFNLAVLSKDGVYAGYSNLYCIDSVEAIEQHIAGKAILHHVALIALVRDITGKLCLPEPYWDNMGATHLRLCALLVNLYAHLDQYETSNELGLNIAVAIAAAAFTFGSYPGGTSPRGLGTTASRADNFVAYHQPPRVVFDGDRELSAGGSREARVEALLGFGLLGVLEHPFAHELTSRDLRSWEKTYKLLEGAYLIDEFDLHFIPRAFNFQAHAAQVMSQCLPKCLLQDAFNQYQADWISCYTTLYSQFIARVIIPEDVHDVFHSVLLTCLCDVEPPKQEQTCIRLLALAVSCNGSCLEILPSNTLKALLDTSLSGKTRIAPTAMCHLWMLSQKILDLEDRSPTISLLLSLLCPIDSAAPKDEIETWLIQQLYPHILVMCRETPRELYESGVLRRIYSDLAPGREITVNDNHGSTVTGDRNLSVRDSTFDTLQGQCSSVIDAENRRWQELPYFPSEEESEN